MSSRHPAARAALACLAALLAIALAASAASAASARTPGHHRHHRAHAGSDPNALAWQACADNADTGLDAQCATAPEPLDYSHPNGRQVRLAVVRIPARDPSRRIGSLFVNFGGPGGDAVATIKSIASSPGDGNIFAALNQRFDIVGFDPRGVGESTPAIDCRANQETQGVYRQPFTTPDTANAGRLVQQDQRYINRCVSLNGDILPYVSTANVARDMDNLRAAVGDRKLTYLGFSYGTFLGATYQSMFPSHTREIVLDGALDPDQYIHDPLSSLDEQTAGFERAIGRFLQACAGNQTTCLGFGATDGDGSSPDPHEALDRLIDTAAAHPIPAPRFTDDPRPVGADDIRAAIVQAVYSKSLWPALAAGLAEADQANDASILRELTDIFYGWEGPGQYDPITDRYFTIGALEQQYPRNVQTYLNEGKRSFQDYPYAYFNHGYSELAWGLYPVQPRGVFDGPWKNPSSGARTLVVGTTYDPATPYKEAQRLVRQLGNAELLTMRGDGHTAYGGNSPCIDADVNAYLEDGTLPPVGTVCQQQVPFLQAAPAPAPQAQRLGGSNAAAQVDATVEHQLSQLAPHVKPLVVH